MNGALAVAQGTTDTLSVVFAGVIIGTLVLCGCVLIITGTLRLITRQGRPRRPQPPRGGQGGAARPSGRLMPLWLSAVSPAR